MKISELIERLGELQGKHGDIEIRIACYKDEEFSEGELNSFKHFESCNVYREHVELSHDDGSFSE